MNAPDEICILVLMLIMIAPVSANERPCNIETVNGCTVPFGLDVPYKKTFTPACDRHDVCYACGKDPRHAINRDKCDEMFHHNMMQICKGEKDEKECKDYATVYFRIVSNFATGFYRQNPREWCGHKQVPGCIEPAA